MANGTIQALYDMAKSDTKFDENGIPKMDEQKLRRALEHNKKLGARNRDNYEAGERKFKTCPRYDPCPICDKCRVIKRKGRVMIICENPKHKQRQG